MPRFRQSFSFLLCLVLAVGCLPPAASAFATPLGDQSATTDAAEVQGILVTLDTAAPEGMRSRAVEDPVQELAQAGMTVAEQVVGADAAQTILRVDPAANQSTSEAVAVAQAISGVVAVQPNYVYRPVDPLEESAADPSVFLPAERMVIPPLVNDPAAQISDSQEARNQYYLYASHTIDAWEDTAFTAQGTIAVLDTGINLSHEDLRDSILHGYAYDAYAQKPLVATEGFTGDWMGHGTHVAGIAAGVGNNNKGIAGAAYAAKILPIKVVDDALYGTGTTLDMVVAYDYLFQLVKSGAVSDLHVVNISMGSYGQHPADFLLQERIACARDTYRIVTVCAGGNGDARGNPYTKPSYPSDFPECVSVTALTPEGTNARWSDYNFSKDISASGVQLYSTYRSSDASYTKMTGTSMASPLVAGAAALCFSVVPDATVDQVCTALYTTATPVIDPVNDRRQTSGSKGALSVDAAIKALQAATIQYRTLAGVTACDTMEAIQKASFEAQSCDTVIVATQAGFPDALAAAGLAGALEMKNGKDIPVLITDRAALSDQTARAIEYLGAKKVIISGGPAVISAEVEASLGALVKATNVRRIFGQTAADTAVKLNEVARSEGTVSPTAILATSKSFADALSIAPYAYTKGAPIYLSEADGSLSAATAAALKKFSAVKIVGGTAVVSQATEDALMREGCAVQRWSGTTLYETSAQIAAAAAAEGALSFASVSIATGKGYCDALSAATAAGASKSVLLLVDEGAEGSYALDAALAPHKTVVKSVDFLGGEVVVTPATKAAIKATLAGA
ncbi:MAG: S8 family serine peptidase [Raoultibacter sp.]